MERPTAEPQVDGPPNETSGRGNRDGTAAADAIAPPVTPSPPGADAAGRTDVMEPSSTPVEDRDGAAAVTDVRRDASTNESGVSTSRDAASDLAPVVVGSPPPASGPLGAQVLPTGSQKFRLVKQSTSGVESVFYEYNYHHQSLLMAPRYGSNSGGVPVKLSGTDFSQLSAAVKLIRFSQTLTRCQPGQQMWGFAKQTGTNDGNTIYLSCIDPTLSRGLVFDGSTVIKTRTFDETTAVPLIELMNTLVKTRPCQSKEEVRGGC